MLPGIATAAFLQANNAAVGSVFPAAVGGATVPVKIVAAVSAFPTVTGADGALIVDLAAVQDYLAGKAQQPLAVTSWWLRAAPGAAAAPGYPARGRWAQPKRRPVEEVVHWNQWGATRPRPEL